MTLKFENTAEVGDTIKAFDFEPIPGRGQSFIMGVVTAKGMTEYGVKGYTIDVGVDSVYQEDPRTVAVVPFQVMFLEFDNRVTKINC